MRASDSNSKRWEALASAARAAADYMTDPLSKELMITIARSYEGLAKRASDLDGVHTALQADEGRPALQGR